MERLSNRAIDIVNELHTERLDYQSEYLPLIDALNRLAAYEDIGLEPEQLNDFVEVSMELIDSGAVPHAIDILKAQAERRLLVLPCKVGDVVYDIRQDIGCRRKNVVVPLSVSGFDVTTCVWETWYGPFPKLKDFGKTIFLTREEAEAALKGGGDHA